MNLTIFSMPRICWSPDDPAGDTPPVTPPAGDPPADPNPPADPADPPADPAEPKDPPADPPAEPEPLTMESITLPEGLAIPEEHQESFLGILNNNELSKADMVNQLLTMQSDALTAAAEQNAQAWVDLRGQWQEQAKALPEIGGDKLEETLANIKTGLEAAGAKQEAFEALDVTGAGDHPALIQLMSKLVKPFLEQPPVPGSPAQEKADLSVRMYPSMAKD